MPFACVLNFLTDLLPNTHCFGEADDAGGVSLTLTFNSLGYINILILFSLIFNDFRDFLIVIHDLSSFHIKIRSV